MVLRIDEMRTYAPPCILYAYVNKKKKAAAAAVAAAPGFFPRSKEKRKKILKRRGRDSDCVCPVCIKEMEPL